MASLERGEPFYSSAVISPNRRERAERRKAAREAFGKLMSKVHGRPPWWRFFARRAWDKRQAALRAMRADATKVRVEHVVAATRLPFRAHMDCVVLSPADFWMLRQRHNAKLQHDPAGYEFIEITYDGMRFRVAADPDRKDVRHAIA